jgi:hypothetical protein
MKQLLVQKQATRHRAEAKVLSHDKQRAANNIIGFTRH